MRVLLRVPIRYIVRVLLRNARCEGSVKSSFSIRYTSEGSVKSSFSIALGI